jgi:hypothetical protein
MSLNFASVFTVASPAAGLSPSGAFLNAALGLGAPLLRATAFLVRAAFEASLFLLAI